MSIENAKAFFDGAASEEYDWRGSTAGIPIDPMDDLPTRRPDHTFHSTIEESIPISPIDELPNNIELGEN